MEISDPFIATGYDITVPGPYTFATASGVFVQDSMNIHVPVTQEAANEIREKMMPSKNLFGIKNNKIHYQPHQEFVLGLFNSSTPNAKKPLHLFASTEEAMAAYHSGAIDLDTPIHIKQHAST